MSGERREAKAEPLGGSDQEKRAGNGGEVRAGKKLDDIPSLRQ